MNSIYYITDSGHTIVATSSPTGGLWSAEIVNCPWRMRWFAQSAGKAIVKVCLFVGGR